MPLLCEQGIHLIQQFPDGSYACCYCGLGFREHHEIHLTVGASGSPGVVTRREGHVDAP